MTRAKIDRVRMVRVAVALVRITGAMATIYPTVQTRRVTERMLRVACVEGTETRLRAGVGGDFVWLEHRLGDTVLNLLCFGAFLYGY